MSGKHYIKIRKKRKGLRTYLVSEYLLWYCVIQNIRKCFSYIDGGIRQVGRLLEVVAYLGLTTPGVSNRTTCFAPSVQAPSMGTLVVLVLGDTADTCQEA